MAISPINSNKGIFQVTTPSPTGAALPRVNANVSAFFSTDTSTHSESVPTNNNPAGSVAATIKQPEHLVPWREMGAEALAAKVDELEAHFKNFDFSEMSKPEIYQYIFDQYENAFGKSFLDSAIYAYQILKACLAKILAVPFNKCYINMFVRSNSPFCTILYKH